MRCPSCGARNPDDAAWCSQCYARFGAVAEASERPEEHPGPQEESETAPQAEEDEPASDDAPVQRGDVRKSADGTLEWRCGRCDTWNPIAADRCGVCGGTFADTVRGRAEDDMPARDPGSVLAASVVLPGLGHAMLGRTGEAIARGGTYLLWLVGGLALLLGGRGSGLTLPALPLLAGALVLLVVTAHDVRVVQHGGGAEILSARVFLWLVVAVLAGLLLAFIPGMFRIGAA